MTGDLLSGVYVAERTCPGVTIEHSDVEGQSGLYGDTHVATCDEGFHSNTDPASANFTITCNEEGAWSGMAYCESKLYEST